MAKPARVLSPEESAIIILMRPIREAEERRLNKILIDLNRRNKALTLAKSDGFLFEGGFVVPTGIGARLPILSQRVALDNSLWGEMRGYIQEKAKTQDELQYVQMTLVRLIRGCKTDQDIRDALPDFLVPFYSPAKGLSRVKPELWTIQNDNRAMQQYRQMEPKLATYAAARLMY